MQQKQKKSLVCGGGSGSGEYRLELGGLEADARRREPAELTVAQGRTVNSEITILLDSELPFPALPAQRLGTERRPLGVRGVGQAQEAAASLVKKATLTAKASCG